MGKLSLPGPCGENERKKLGPLGLRLIERLVGPALQIAKGIGIDKLSEATGVATLIQALEQDLMPQRRQMAVEMYQAGSVPGMLSRQTQEPMSSYVLRREAWWVQLQELDTDVRCSPAILGEQMLAQAGLSQMEQQLVRTVLKNDLSQSKELAKTLREQFGQVHEREKGKGRGKDFGGKSRWQGWSRNHGHS